MSKKILVIDDENDVVEILKTILEHEKYEVISSYGGEDGLKKAIASKPDLIITDIMMPGMDGFEFVQKLKENMETFNIPVIMLTAKDQGVDREKGLALGVIAYIVKLFDLEELISTVKDAVEKKK
ncbi:MAG: response regulator [Candidatus Saganbacteria bacterium]|nr:response regulator [Candidatus Saganbacteria bacterium]